MQRNALRLLLRLRLRAAPRPQGPGEPVDGLGDRPAELNTRAWDQELLETLGLDAERLPRDLRRAGRRLAYRALDGACSNLGAGCVARDRAALMVGTSGAFRTVYETEQPQPRTGLFLHWLDDARVVEGGSLSDGGSLYKWVEQTFKDSDGSLADRDPDSHGLTFLTLLGGERSPGWHQHATGAIRGLTFATTPLDLRQAALEGVAFRFAEIADLMPEVEEIVATGGALLKDDDWLQIMADALARPVTASAVKEASLRGAAVLRSSARASRRRHRSARVSSSRERGRVPRRARAAAQLYDAVTGSATSSRAAAAMCSASMP